MDQINLLSQSFTIILIVYISVIFLIVGIVYSKKYQGIDNYLVANRSVGTFSLTTSLVASALGAWILFGPASAATWGGIGAVIGYALGTAFPLFILIYLGKKFRILYPKKKTLRWRSLSPHANLQVVISRVCRLKENTCFHHNKQIW